MKRFVFHIICFLVGLVLGFLLFKKGGNPELTTIVKTDTLTIVKTDTIKEIQPVYLTTRIVDTIKIKVNDTLYFPLQIEQKKYIGEKYEAYISGFKPKLDSISIFNAETIKYITKEVKVKNKPKKWGIGLQVGGFYHDNKIKPYVGAGISYNFIRF